MLRLTLLGGAVTITVGRDGGSEEGSAGLQQSQPKAGSGTYRDSRQPAITNWLAGRWPPTQAADRTYPELRADGTFWAALDQAEQRDFMAIAQRRIFASGATLMREGEPADHVLVVLSGRTKICISEDGRELLLAERGPGELIGERAALVVSERSATVIALDTVHALVVTTQRFAEYVSAHPGVLSLVEGQVYARLREGRETVIRRRRLNLVGENCTVVLTDVGGFGGAHRNDEDRQIVRQALYEMTRGVLDSLDTVCSCEDRGDGFLVVIPPDVPTSRVVERLLQELPPRLRRHNHTYSAAVKIQLRVAVTVGPVVSDPTGMSGDAIISAARLVEAPVLKDGMLTHQPNLGMIASVFVYETAIKPAVGDADPTGYEPVQVTLKESSLAAWMKLIDPRASRSPLISCA